MFNSLLRFKLTPWMAFAFAVMLLGLFQNCNQKLTKDHGEDGGPSELVLPPATEQHPPPPVEKTKMETSFEPLLADREYVMALFEYVFGPTAATVEGMALGRNSVEFGSPCSIYEDFKIRNSSGKLVLADPDNACSLTNSASVLGASLNPRPTVTRQAILLKSCTNLVLNPTTLAYALSKISQFEPVPAPTDANVRNLFRLFYLENSEPSAELLQALEAMMDPAQMTAESWRAPIYSVCSSSYWQVL